jgi:hypothetical protein
MGDFHALAEALAYNITKKHGLNRCKECAGELVAAFISHKMSGYVHVLSVRGKWNMIVMKDPLFKLPFVAPPDCAISTNGKHYGVQVGNFIFDNIYKRGIISSSWVESFDSPNNIEHSSYAF